MAFTGRPRKEKRTKEPAKTFIGYIRASTKDQKITLEAQQVNMVAFCKRNDYELLDIVVDTACSTKMREKLIDVQRRLDAGEAQGLLCVKFDRVGRSQIHLASLIQWAEGHVDILSVDEGWIIKAGRKANDMIPFIIAFAEVELTKIRSRTKEALDMLKEEGKKLGHAPRNLELGERIYKMRAAGQPWRQIVNQLNEEGLTTGKGKPLTPGSVYRFAEVWAGTQELEMPRVQA